MEKYQVNLMSYATLLFLGTALQYTFAEKSHWNPTPISLYHVFRFPVRTEDKVKDKIEYQGWTYAGRGEFPWLVEIRGNNTENFEEEEDWANGNLVSSRFVLTVCTAVVNFKSYDPTPAIRNDPMISGLDIELTYLSPKNPKFYKVMYSDDYTYKTVGNGYYTGTRQVKRFIPHPKCNHLELDFQWGMVETKRPIWPVPPWTSYMPMRFEPQAWANIKEKFVYNKLDLEKNAPCTVGLWSRRLAAVYKGKLDPYDRRERVKAVYNNTKLRNYKIKYSVFPTDPNDCWENKALSTFPKRVRIGETLEEFECMAINTNETIGTVCDRDRGAPIVCDGAVRAIVLMGAVEEFCNITNPMPFLVLDLKYAMEMFGEVSNEEWILAGLKHYLET